MDNSDNETGFRIYDSSNKLLADNIPSKEGSGEYQYQNVTGLECGTVYTFNVVAYNSAGESAKSPAKSIRTSKCDNKLPTVTVTATPQSVTKESQDSVTFTCTGEDEDGTIESYKWSKGGVEVSTNKTFTTNDFAVGENRYTCEVKDDRNGRASADVTVTVTSDKPTAYATATPSSVTEGEQSTLSCSGNDTYTAGIKEYIWSKKGTQLATGSTYLTSKNLTEGNYTYSCEVVYKDNKTATSDVTVTIKALSEDLENITPRVQDFESYNIGEYDPSDKNSPLYYIGDVSKSGITFNSFGVVDRDGSKAFCMDINVTGTSWSKMFMLNIPGLDNAHPVNVAGKIDFKFDYKETLSDKYNAIAWLNLYDRVLYTRGGATSTTSGGSLLTNIDPGTWQKGDIENFNYRFGFSRPELEGADYYGIKYGDESAEIRAIALKISNSTGANKAESFNFCIDNISIRGTQMKKDIFDTKYKSDHKAWSDYQDRIFPQLSALNNRKKSLSGAPDCPTGLSEKRDYQCHKLTALKSYIDKKLNKINSDFSSMGTFYSKDVQRTKESMSRYEATYKAYNNPPPVDGFKTYRVPAMKYGRLDGYTFPMDYNTTKDNPYSLKMAKGEYKSIAILLDPGKNYNKILKFTNTDFNSGGGVTLDKYIAKIWYQSGKNDSIFDNRAGGEFSNYPNNGNAWLTQELLLKNDALVKIEHDPNEKNLYFYKGKNWLYTTRKDGGSEDFGEYGSVPGYVWISSTEQTPYDIKDGNGRTTYNRYNLKSSDSNLLVFDDSKTIQPFKLNGSYKLLWAIIHVDDNAQAGTHSANIEIKDSSNNIVKSIPINIEVLNYKLVKSILDYGVYYHGRYASSLPVHSVWARPNYINKTHKQLQKDLKDMREHGISYPLVETGSSPGNNAYANNLMDDLETLGFPNDKFFSWDGNVFARSATDPNNILSLQNDMENHSYFGNAQLYIGVVDEASTSQIVDIKRYIKDTIRGDKWKDKLHVKTWGGALRSSVEYLADGGYLDAPIISDYDKWAVGKYKKAEKDEKGNPTDGATVYKYGDPQAGVENPEVYRRSYGIKMYQDGFNGGGMDYAYQKQYGFFWNDFDLAYTFEKNHREEAFTYPTSGLNGGKGFVGTIQWEGYREAITDVQYISTLLEKDPGAKSFVDSLDTKNGDLDKIREQVINKIGN